MDGTSNSYPDWIQVTFNGNKTIDEIDVFTLQDNYSNPSEPTESMTFSQYGIVDFQIQYWNGIGWQTVSGGSVTGNNKVWKKVNFSQITTNKIRVNVTNALNNYSRVTELEAWGPGLGINYSYDAAGNLTNDGPHTYQYDSGNRLVSVDSGSNASYAYDHQNRRYKKIVGSSVTHYVWEGAQVIAEHNGSTGAVLVDYIYNGSRMIAKVAGSTTNYFLSDLLSVRVTLDTSGNVLGRQAHLPFGEEFGATGTQEKHHLTNYERDGQSGSDYAVNRYYSAGVGRFHSADPFHSSNDTTAPQSWNRYAYVMDDPTDFIDPLGLVRRTPGPGDPCDLDPEVEKPQIFFSKAVWDIVSVPFVGNLAAEITLSGAPCQGSEFTVSVHYTVLNALGSLYVSADVSASKDDAFKVIKDDSHYEGSGEITKKRTDIRLIRKPESKKRGKINVKVKALGLDRQPTYRLGVVLLKCL